MSSSGTTRRAAFDVLQAVHDKDAYSNLVLPAVLDELKVSSRDAGLATEITYGALRRQGSLDAVIVLARPEPTQWIAKYETSCELVLINCSLCGFQHMLP